MPMQSRSLTQGPILKGVIAFALPLLGTSVIQQLYSTVDFLFVGNVLGTSSIAALGIGSLLITILAGLFTGVSVAINVKVANIFGSGDSEALGRALRSSALASVAFGMLLVVAGELLSASFVQWMQVPPESAGAALVYVRYGVAAALPIALYNAAAGALRGLGDSRSPLIAQAAGGLLNIAANWVALCVFKWGIAGAAFATFASNSVAAAIGIAFLVRSGAYAESSAGSGLDRSFAFFLLTFGAPIGAQTIAMVFSNVAVQYQIDLLGVQAIAAFAVYLKVELPIYYVIIAIGQATTTFVAQNHGAGCAGRCEKGIAACQILCLVLAVFMSIVMIGIGYWAFWLFDRSEAVIANGLLIIHTTFPFYFVYAVLEVQGDAIRGYGHSLAPAIVVLANICLLRVVLEFAFAALGLGLQAIAATYPITWTTAALCMVAVRAFLSRRRMQNVL